MSADLLRAAAARLRDTAAKATPGPWAASEHVEHGFRVATADEAGWVAWTGAYDDEPDESRGDAAWIALASPLLAEPLAAWLDQAVKGCDASILAAQQVWPDNPAAREEFIAEQTPTEALKVARVILEAAASGAPTKSGERGSAGSGR